MTRKVTMDWVLFWTILILVGIGLVMVYSSSSVVMELRATSSQNTGSIVQVASNAVDVQFTRGYVPAPGTALSVTIETPEEEPRKVEYEVAMDLGEGLVRAITAAPVKGIEPGMKAVSLSRPAASPASREAIERAGSIPLPPASPGGGAGASPGWSSRRAAAALLGIVCLLWLGWRYRNGTISKGWALLGLGWVAFVQATAYWMDLDYAPHYALAVKQLFAALLGFAALIYISQRDYARLRTAQSAFGALGLVIFLLILVYFVDPKAHRWIKILGVSIQPSELAKPALVLFLAWFVTLRGNVNHRNTIWPATLALVMLAGGVIVADFGTALVLVATAAAIFFLAGLSRTYTLAAICAGTVLLAGAIVAKPYRLKRVVDFVDPQYNMLASVDPDKRLEGYLERNSIVKDTSYQAEQAQIALGAGGFWGRGIGNSRQKLLYLPASHNDFIFAIAGEEMGLWGCSLLLGAFVVILWRGFRLYFTAPDDFGRFIAIGVTTSLVFQALLNMSVVVGLFPTKGIPLPLISYGGSSLVGTMISLGLLLGVSQRAIRSA
ncbi:MAG: FtsW/RodA/SpoVE family cell cycle protein [Bryobacteraceae bacterium]